jgi:uncharacterized protein YjbI with pentapeptide repeats
MAQPEMRVYRSLRGWLSRLPGLPRWYPTIDELSDLAPDTLLALRARTVASIERNVLTLLALGAFSALALQSPDSLLLSERPSVHLPLVGSEISFAGFLIAGPLLLGGVWMNLHILMRHYRLENRALAEQSVHPVPAWSEARHPFVMAILAFAYLFLVPLVMLSFTYKSAAIPGYGGVLLLATLGVIWMHVVAGLRWVTHPRLWRACNVGVACVFLLLGWMCSSAAEDVVRPLDLYRADLAGAFLPNADLRYADAARANLEGAVLIEADLSGANLGNARLAGADLKRAKLQNAEFHWTDLSEADLSGANLSGSSFIHTDLRKANLSSASLNGSRMTGVDASGANFEYAYFDGAFVEGSIFAGARLTGASFAGATDNAAFLGGPSLSESNGVRLSPEQRAQLAPSGRDQGRPIYDRDGNIIGSDRSEFSPEDVEAFFDGAPWQTGADYADNP